MLGDALRFIRFSHTIFALPFAVGAMVVAARGWPGWGIFGLILVAMVCARTAAMVFNRLADWEMDQRNPRTAARHKLLARPAARALLVASTVAFVAGTHFLNPLCFALSPVALAIIFLYSLTKRFTHNSHFFLGLALAVAPVGAWLAVTGAFAPPPLVLAAAVLVWVAGFDIIYATQDFEFDCAEGLHSLVVKYGIPRALSIARALHIFAFLLLAAFGWLAVVGPLYGVALFLIAAALFYEHRIARHRDLAAINRAFFTSNAFVGAVFLAAIAGRFLWG